MHHAAHAKPAKITRLSNALKAVALAYTKAHKKFRVAGGAFVFTVEFSALILTHEFMIHLGIILCTWGWDTLVTLSER